MFFILTNQLCETNTDGTARIFFYHLMPRQGFEPTTSELQQPVTFSRMLYRLNYRSAAKNKVLIVIDLCRNRDGRTSQRLDRRDLGPRERKLLQDGSRGKVRSEVGSVLRAEGHVTQQWRSLR